MVASICAATLLSAGVAEAHEFKVTKTEKRRQKVTFTDTNPCNNDPLQGQGEERIETTTEASATETRITEERSLDGYAFSIANPAVRYDYEDTLRQKDVFRTSAQRFSFTTTRRTHAIRDREHKRKGHIGHESFFRFERMVISNIPGEEFAFEQRVKCSRKGDHD